MDTTTTYECAEHGSLDYCSTCADDCIIFCKHGHEVYKSSMTFADVCIYTNPKCTTIHKCACGEYLVNSLQKSKNEDDVGDVSRPGNWYMITLTQPDNDKTVESRIKSAKKILKSKQVQPEQWCYSIELTAKGTPHIHIALFTYKYPEYRFISKFNDGHRIDIQREKFNVKNYVVKNDTKPTSEQIADWGLTSWFYCSDNYSGPRPSDQFEIKSSTDV